MRSRETYPRRLIEVELPIKRISAHARREKAIRHGHISTLHIWWARRPLAACRAVICSALWPDPADPLCPQAFIEAARKQMLAWAPYERQKLLSEESRKRFEKARQNPAIFNDVAELRSAVLDFVADFANWDNSNVREYLDTSRALTQAAHVALGGAPGTRPLLVDPFAGGGSIPLEALRVGADAFASDLNPVPVLLNKVVLEYIPRYGQLLADEVRKWGDWIKREAEIELAEFYPKDADGATPIAYLWARTIRCEGPGCGAQVPFIRSLWLSKKKNRSTAIQLVPNPKARCVDFRIIIKQREGWVDQANPKVRIANPQFDGTVKRGSATCPCCSFTTPVARVREQLKSRRGGANDARLFCVVTTRLLESGRYYRLPVESDLRAVKKARSELKRQKGAHEVPISFVPDERLDVRGIRHTWAMIYGISEWGDCFTDRQALALGTFARLIRRLDDQIGKSADPAFISAIQSVLALAVGRLADYSSSLCRWVASGEFIGNTFGRQALPMMWDFCEVYPSSDSTGGFPGACDWIVAVLNREAVSSLSVGHAQVASATAHPLPDDSASAIVTDPPYYDAVPYAFLSDFFYVWLRRNLINVHPDLFDSTVVAKDAEIVVDRPHEMSNSTHDIEYYERELTKAFGEARRVLRPDGIGTIVFASKTTASWEAILKAVVDAGWIVTGSWPIDTEMEARIAAAGQARLASSVHLVCRPRESADGMVRMDEVGDWRGVLHELPGRIHEWMPRLADEGVVGADAIFACLGPALEIFSRYSRVEKASGETVSLKEYLERVWAAVSKEALAMIFAGADATGFEEDARLTAMWLWTLSTASNGERDSTADDVEVGEDEEDQSANGKSKLGGFVLEYDAARKIAQGLGAHLEALSTLVEVKGATARLLPVAERTRSLFQMGEAATLSGGRKSKRKTGQLTLVFVADLEEAEESGGWGGTGAPQKGESVLDRVHQSMILFGAGRGEALRRFLVDDGVGRDDRFWRLAQALSALYPVTTDEKRWVDGVLARKKGFGF